MIGHFTRETQSNDLNLQCIFKSCHKPLTHRAHAQNTICTNIDFSQNILLFSLRTSISHFCTHSNIIDYPCLHLKIAGNVIILTNSFISKSYIGLNIANYKHLEIWFDWNWAALCMISGYGLNKVKGILWDRRWSLPSIRIFFPHMHF